MWSAKQKKLTALVYSLTTSAPSHALHPSSHDFHIWINHFQRNFLNTKSTSCQNNCLWTFTALLQDKKTPFYVFVLDSFFSRSEHRHTPAPDRQSIKRVDGNSISFRNVRDNKAGWARRCSGRAGVHVYDQKFHCRGAVQLGHFVFFLIDSIMRESLQNFFEDCNSILQKKTATGPRIFLFQNDHAIFCFPFPSKLALSVKITS